MFEVFGLSPLSPLSPLQEDGVRDRVVLPKGHAFSMGGCPLFNFHKPFSLFSFFFFFFLGDRGDREDIVVIKE